jgi:hypothetical protein
MANGWTPERRAKQEAAIRTWKPWEKSTGPVTEAGKESSSQNAFVHGGYNVDAKYASKRIADLIRDSKELLRSMR